MLEIKFIRQNQEKFKKESWFLPKKHLEIKKIG
jgi:hypothetical protein